MVRTLIQIDPVIYQDAELLSKSRDLVSKYSSHFNSNILVSGASGMLGEYIATCLATFKAINGFAGKIYILANHPSPFLVYMLKHFPAQIVRVQDLQLLSSLEISTFYKSDGMSSNPNSWSNLKNLVESNTQNLLGYIDKLATKDFRLVLFSTGEHYGDAKVIPTPENYYSHIDSLNPLSIYSGIKLASELIAINASIFLDIKLTILRIFATFGPGVRLNDKRIFGQVMNSALNGQDFILESDGLARRTFLYSYDLLTAILVAGQIDKFQTYNVGGESDVSILEFLNLASELLKFQVSDARQTRNNSLSFHRGSPDISKIKTLGWKPVIPLSLSLQKTFESLVWRKNQHLLQ